MTDPMSNIASWITDATAVLRSLEWSRPGLEGPACPYCLESGDHHPSCTLRRLLDSTRCQQTPAK